MISRSKRREGWSGTQDRRTGTTMEERDEQADVEDHRPRAERRCPSPPRAWGSTPNRRVQVALCTLTVITTAFGFASSHGGLPGPAESPGGRAADGDSCAVAPLFVPVEDAWPTCSLGPPAGVGAAPPEATRGAAATEPTATTVTAEETLYSSSTVGVEYGDIAGESGGADGRSDGAESTAAGAEENARRGAHVPVEGGRLEAAPAASASAGPASAAREVAVAPTPLPPADVHDDSLQGAAEEKPSSAEEVGAPLPSSVRFPTAGGEVVGSGGGDDEEMFPAAFLNVITAEREVSDAARTLEKLELDVEADEKEVLPSTPTFIPASDGSASAALSSEVKSAAGSKPVSPLSAPEHASLPATATPGVLVVDVSPLSPFLESIATPVKPKTAVPPEFEQQAEVDSLPFLPAPLPFESFGPAGEESMSPPDWSPLQEARSVVEPLAGGETPQDEDDHTSSASTSEVVTTGVGALEDGPRPPLPVRGDESTEAMTNELDLALGKSPRGTPSDSTLEAPSAAASEVDGAPALPEPEGGPTSATASASYDECVPETTLSGETSDLESTATMNAGGASPTRAAPVLLPPGDGPGIAASAATQHNGAASAGTPPQSCPAPPPGWSLPETCTDVAASLSPSIAEEEEQDLAAACDNTRLDGATKADSLDAPPATLVCPPAVLVPQPERGAEPLCPLDGDRVEAVEKEEEEGKFGDESGGDGGKTVVGDLAVEQDGLGGDDTAGLEALVREFNGWVASVEFPVRKVEAGLVGDGMRLGLVATEAIEKGEPYLSVPESMVLDASKVRNDPELGPPLAKLEDLLSPLGMWDEDGESLRVSLIAEAFVRADRSPWVSYLRLLPTPSDVKAYHPLFFDDATIASLEGSDVQAFLRQHRDSEVAGFDRKFGAEESAGREFEDVLGAGWITLERYLWAAAILDSRCIWWEGRRHLVPLLDLVNYAPGDPSISFQETFQESNGYAVTAAARSFDGGEQVFEDYGHPNHLLLSVHGFSLGRENIRDCVRIDAQRPPRGAAEYPQTLARMQEAFPEGRPMFCVSLRGNDAHHFISYVRIMAGLSALPDQQRPSSADRATEPSGVAGVPGVAGQQAPTRVSVDCGGGEIDCSRPPPTDSVTSEDTDQGRPHARAPEAKETIHAPSAPDGRRAAHERWEALRNDPEGLRAVLDTLGPRLSRHPYSERSVRGGGVGVSRIGGDEDAADEDGADFATGGDNSCNDFSPGTTEAARVFLDSEGFLLQELYGVLETMLPLNEVSTVPGEHSSGAQNSSSTLPESPGEEVAADHSASRGDGLPSTESEKNVADDTHDNDIGQT